MATCIITLKDIMVYQNEISARESGGLTPSELFQVKDMMVANQISNLSDLNTILTRIFRENGETVLDVQAAYDSGLYSLEEMKNLDIDLVDEMLDKINYTLSKGDVIVELTDNEKAPYKDSSRTTALGTYVQVGTDRVLEDLQKNINNFQDEAEFYSKVKELPYTDFVEKFYEDKTFADSVIQSFKNLTRIPVITISGEKLSQDNAETSEVLSNTLRTDIDFIQMEADVEYLIDIDNDVWDDSPNEIRGLLSRLEKTFAGQGLDIVGISKKFSNRVEVKAFLSEFKDFLRNVEDRNVGQKEIEEFSKKYDDFFGKKAATTVVSLPNNYQGLSVLQLNTELSASELFGKHGLIHIGGNLYHKVSQEKDNAELYEYLYKEVVEGRKNIPIRFQNKKEAQDVLNKEKALQDISKFVNNRETGIEVVDRENLSLNQLVFDHTPIPKPEINAVKNKVGSIVTEDTNYLKTDFITDFYQYVLEEKIKDTELYRKVLSKFKFTDAGITLDGYVPSLEGIKYLEEFQDYIRLKRSTEMDYLVENTNLADDNKTFINQPDLLEEYRGSAILDTGYVITAPNFEEYIKVSGKLYKKVITEILAHLYAPVINEVDNVYYDTEATVLFDKSEAEKILKNYNKTSENTLSTQNAKDLIKKSGVESSLYKKIKAKAKEITKSLGFNIIGEQGATNLDRQQEVSYRLNNLLIAKEMQDKGIEASKIKLTTGWEQMNGEWMYEVEDVFFNDDFEPEVGKEYNYLDIVKPNEFTKAYPQLKNVKIKFNNDGTNNFTEDGGIINLDAEGYSKNLFGQRGPANTKDKLKPTIYTRRDRLNGLLVHETTHFTQRREGFFEGGSPAVIVRRAYMVSGVEESDEANVAFEKIKEKFFSKDSNLTQSDRNVLRAVLLDMSEKMPGEVARAYEDIAGEAVARNIQRRTVLSPQEKLNSLLKDTEIDVREEDKIFLRGTDISNKVFEKNLVTFIREKGVQVVTDPTEVQRVLKESGLDINPMISITNDLGVVERPTIKINGNTITVKEDVSSPRIKTLGAAVEVTDRIYAKVVNKLKEIAGPLYKPSFVTKTATTITLNVPVGIKEKAQELKDYYEEVYQIMADEAIQEETIDDAFRKDVISELRRGATIVQLKSFGYNFLQTPTGNVLGFEKDGVIYLDEAQLNNTTTIHESVHVFQSMLDVKAAKGDKKAQEIINKRKELFQPMVDEWKKFHEGKIGVGNVNAIIDIKNNQIGNKLPIIIPITDLFNLASNFEDTNLSVIFDTEEFKNLVPGIDISETTVNFRKDDTGENYGGASVFHVGNEIKSIAVYFSQSEINEGPDYIRKAVVRRVSHEAQHLYDMSVGRNYGGNSHTIGEKLSTASQRVRGILEQIDSRSENKNYSALEGISTGVYLALSGENRARINELQENGVIDENNNFNIEVPESLQIENEEQIKNLIENLDEDTAQYYYELGSYYHSNTKLPESRLNFNTLSPEAEQLKDTIGLDLSSSAYAQRANESSEEWNTRLLKEVEAYITAPEIAARLEKLQKEKPSLWQQIMDYINQLTDWLKGQIGLPDYKGNIMDMSKDEYISALGISVLKDDYSEVKKETTYTEKQEKIKEFSTILDNHVEVVSLYNSEEEEDIYNEIDNCGI